ncbi:MAG TPA: response regulator transcription factor [Aestuariivirgaceae bacterium]|nr:response regulator transcription factor [Aestuariivirgaceae bacterium]
MTDIRHVALVADDDEFFRMAISSILLERIGVAEVIEVGSLDEAMERLGERSDITIALFDLAMPGMHGPANLGAVRETFPDILTAVVSASRRRQDILTTLDAGAHGYVPKGMGVEDLTHALQAILEGTIYVPPLLAQVSPEDHDGSGSQFSGIERRVAPDVLARLTPRQRDVLELLVKGHSNKEIARTLDLGEGTVKIHLAALFRNLGVRNRATAAVAGAQLIGAQ